MAMQPNELFVNNLNYINSLLMSGKTETYLLVLLL
jgi:hypothetical protein